MLLTSRQNEKVKAFIKLSASSKQRRARKMFTLEGARLCFDAVKSDCIISEVFYTQKALEQYQTYLIPILERAKNAFEITQPIADAMADTKTTQGVFAIVEMQENPTAIDYTKKYIALENIQNPANLGAIARTASAMGIYGMIVNGGCDIYTPQAQRSAMGALLRLPVIEVGDMVETIKHCNEKGMQTIASVARNNAVPVTQVAFQENSVLVIGNEGNGLSDSCIKSCTIQTTIPMDDKTESLNAANAAAILLWEMVRLGR